MEEEDPWKLKGGASLKTALRLRVARAGAGEGSKVAEGG